MSNFYRHSGLQALKNSYQSNHLLIRMYKFLWNSEKGYLITWLNGYNCVCGNEIAYIFAKEATGIIETSLQKFVYSHLHF